MRKILLLLCAIFFISASAQADYKDNIGYTLLQSKLGGGMPDGSRVMVAEVEAATSMLDHDNDPDTPDVPAYLPDPADSQFAGKTLNVMSGSESGLYSRHATGTGRTFFGNSFSQIPGINTIDCYWVNHWLDSGFLNGGRSAQPFSSSSRVANHSWIGNTDNPVSTSQLLRRLDWLVETDEFIQVVGMNNGSTNRPLLGSSFNAIAVGHTDGNPVKGIVDLDDTYGSGHTKPDIVAPMSSTSSATPVIASSTALLIDLGHNNQALSTDPVIQLTTNRNNDIIYNAERSEVIKAALMAGADRVTDNDIEANITDYRSVPENRTANGLDSRFGAGQINIYNSYHIIEAGEQNSYEDAPKNGGNIDRFGFDYDPFFGGLEGNNSKASYFFTADDDLSIFTASLIWNIDIKGGEENSFDGFDLFYGMDLFIYGFIDDEWSLLGSSTSTEDNTETLRLSLLSGQDYMLQVALGQGQAEFLWDYALAWQTGSPVPIPGGAYLLGPGLIALVRIRRRR